MARRVCRSTVDGWSSLSSDLLEQISKRLGIEDYARVKAVCKSWRLLLKERPFLHNPHNQIPWLAIPDETSSICKFYNLKEDRFHHIYLPELRDSLCIGSSHGWMIVLDKSLNVFLLNPLTRSRIQLPSITSFSGVIPTSTPWYEEFDTSKTYYKWEEEEDEDEHKDDDDKSEDSPDDPKRFCAEFLQVLFFKKVILSDNPSLTGDYIVMAICGRLSRLAYCRPGADKWTLVDNDTRSYQDLIYWKQSFYALDSYRQLYVCDLGGKVSQVSALVPIPPLCGFKYYLAISEENLLLICRSRKREYYNGGKTNEFKVYKLDKERLNWVQFIANLENRILFVGSNFGLSFGVDKFPECKANRIYFTDDFVGGSSDFFAGWRDILIAGHDMGCYDFKTHKTEALPCFPIPALTVWPPPIWATLAPY